MTNVTKPFSIMVAALILTIVASPLAYAQDPDLPEMSDEAKAAMNAWMELRNPGEHHKHLAALVGEWTSDITMWMEPGAAPMVEKGSTEVRFILGGRFLEWTHSGVFGGMPFEARQIDGYNNGDQRYEAIWADNFGTLILHYTGECEDDGKVRTMHTEFSDPMGGEGKISNRLLFTWQDEDHVLFESFMTQGGEEFKNMVIRYSRVK